ncbi:MAG TPA: F0F1 ATP synthase subunit A [Bacillota bacterium]|nr:F0F1 ATP synthase subunit A [Bacillota bacterium]
MEIHNNIIFLWGLEFDLWIILMSWMVMGIIIFLVWLGVRKLSWIPSGWQNVMEMLVEFIENSVKDSLGEHGIKYTYFFGSLFLFILVANMLGLIPGFASPTRDVSVTMALAILVVIWMQYIGIRESGLLKYLKHFVSPSPAFFPLHLMELFTRPLTLALRLFGNIFAGEILVEKLTETFHLVIPSVWLLMSVMIGGIQAYIFTVLSLAYTGLSIEEHD